MARLHSSESGDQAGGDGAEALKRAAIRLFAERGIAVVGLEPSCLLTLRDELQSMGLGPDARTIADHALLLEEFLAHQAQGGKLDALKARLKPLDQPILLHGHCHQKAFGAVSPILDVIKLIPGARPELIDSSCCGMAGSFGYEAEHVDVSLQMAEMSLLPAVRAASPETVIVTDGTSCRHQIADGAGRERSESGDAQGELAEASAQD